MRDYQEYLMRTPLRTVRRDYSAAEDFLCNYGLADLPGDRPLLDGLDAGSSPFLAEQGIDAWSLLDLLAEFLRRIEQEPPEIRELTIDGGINKDGTAEVSGLRIRDGEVISVVGVTGSGKSQLLSDIECAANGDTPSRRVIRYNGEPLTDGQRMSAANRMAAQLTQNMNFVVDISVEEFLATHVNCRGIPDGEELMRRCFEIANELSGEPFRKETKVTRLSGGQARALMIADAHCIGDAPVLLIDEIENAGIDRIRAVDLLSEGGKIVLLATHDPLLALHTPKRIVMKNGGISAVVETGPEEKELLEYLKREDARISALRDRIREGEQIHDLGTI